MGKIIFILGGVRSGKSSYAIEKALRLDKKVAFIATCSYFDKEMKERIEIHKKNRPGHWPLFEEPQNIPLLLKRLGSKFKVVIIDCLTLFISNLLSEGFNEQEIVAQVFKIVRTVKSVKCKLIIISNEVGLGLVPKNPLARRFRDLAGRVNQLVAQEADEVFFMISGLPWKLRGGKR